MTITKQDLIDMWGSGDSPAVIIEIIDRLEALESKSTRFKKPTLQDVQVYMDERDCNLYLTEGESFINYFESVGWVIGKNKPMKDWKAAVRTWLSNNSQPTDRQKVSKGLRNIRDTDW